MSAILFNRHFDLIVLDMALPDADGLSLCRFVCETYAIPLILLSALTETSDRVTGLEMGADDYLVKPFDPRELVARIRSVLRRSSRFPVFTHRQAPDCYCFANWLMDIGKREIQNQQNGQTLEFGDAEFRLLRVLLENPNTILSRNRLLDLTNQPQNDVFDRSIDTLISRVRRKLGDDAKHPRLLRTVWGKGYILTADVSRSPGP